MTKTKSRPRGLIAIWLIAMLSSANARASDLYGAIGYSPSTGWHHAAVQPSRMAAEQAVLATCRRQARDCTAPVWVQNGCVALAVGRGRGFGSGWGSTHDAAQQMAVSVCRQNTADCRLQRTSCTAD
jgi:serine/threonine-protein kinase